MPRILVMSDTHFGIEESTISLPQNRAAAAERNAKRRNVDALINFLRDPPIEEVILIGDIFDMIFSNFHSALEASEYFFDGLIRVCP